MKSVQCAHHNFIQRNTIWLCVCVTHSHSAFLVSDTLNLTGLDRATWIKTTTIKTKHAEEQKQCRSMVVVVLFCCYIVADMLFLLFVCQVPHCHSTFSIFMLRLGVSLLFSDIAFNLIVTEAMFQCEKCFISRLISQLFSALYVAFITHSVFYG